MLDSPGIGGKSEIRSRRILHADDNRTVATLGTRFLKTKRCEVESVANGKEVSAAHDLVMLDYAMPELDGLQCAKAIRNNGYAVKIVVFSNSLPDGVKHEFLALGVKRVLYKSAAFASLHQIIEELLNPPEAKPIWSAVEGGGLGHEPLATPKDKTQYENEIQAK